MKYWCIHFGAEFYIATLLLSSLTTCLTQSSVALFSWHTLYLVSMHPVCLNMSVSLILSTELSPATSLSNIQGSFNNSRLQLPVSVIFWLCCSQTPGLTYYNWFWSRWVLSQEFLYCCYQRRETDHSMIPLKVRDRVIATSVCCIIVIHDWCNMEY